MIRLRRRLNRIPAKRYLIKTDLFLRISSLSVLAYIVIGRVVATDLVPFDKRIFVYVLLSPILLYVLNLFYSFSNYKFWLNGIRNKYLTGYISIILLYSTLLLGLIIFNPKPPVLLIPNLQNGTFGFRAWKCKVAIESIAVVYLDTNKHWTLIPNSIIMDSNNWVTRQFEINPRIFTNDTTNSYLSNETVIMENSAVIFYPSELSKRLIYSDIIIRVRFRFLKIDSVKHYPGFSILTKIDTHPEIVDNKLSFSELCLQYNLNAYALSHPWLPVMERLPGILNRASQSEMRLHGGFNLPLEINKSYSVSALIIGNQVIFEGHGDHGTCYLYESIIQD